MVLGLSLIVAIFKEWKASYQAAFAKAVAKWDQIATLVPSSGSGNIYPMLSQWPEFKEWLGDRVFKNLKVSKYELTNRQFESSVEVPVNTIKDDTFGVFKPMMEFMGDAAARFPDKLVFQAVAAGATSLCYDGQFFYDTDHPIVVDEVATTASNYDATGGGALWVLVDTKRPLKPFILQEREKITFKQLTKVDDETVLISNMYRYGADGRFAAGYGFWQMAYGSLNTLNAANFLTYRAAMMARKSDEGGPLEIMPDTIIVGPSLEATARELFLTPTLSGGGANPNFGLCKVVVTPYLT